MSRNPFYLPNHWAVGVYSFANALTIHQENGWHPAWSPDGRYIVFESNFSGCTDLYRIDAEGTNRTELTFHRFKLISSDCSDEYPAWSPDGKKIAFVSRRKSLPWAKALDIDVMNADRSGIRRLTRYGGSSVLNPLSECAHPAWSPDGKMISFVCQIVDDSTFDTIPPAIYLMNADGSYLHKLVDIDTNLVNWPTSSPSWSPDSRSLIFMQDASQYDSAIYRINIDGTAKKRLSRNFTMLSNAAWSPDCSKIMFIGRDTSTDPAADDYLFMVNADGSHITRVTRFHGGGPVYISWSPDGTRIAFGDENNHTLYIMNADGTGVSQLTKCCL